MTARIVISCNGVWHRDFPCRGAYISRTLSPDEAREQAHREGWSGGPGRDLCHAHTLLAQRQVARD